MLFVALAFAIGTTAFAQTQTPAAKPAQTAPAAVPAAKPAPAQAAPAKEEPKKAEAKKDDAKPAKGHAHHAAKKSEKAEEKK